MSGHASRVVPASTRVANLSHFLSQAARRHPDAIGFVWRDAVWTWREMEARVDALRLLNVASGLTELQCEVLALRFGAGLSIVETADQIGRSPEAAKQLQYRALEVLREADRAGRG